MSIDIEFGDVFFPTIKEIGQLEIETNDKLVNKFLILSNTLDVDIEHLNLKNNKLNLSPVYYELYNNVKNSITSKNFEVARELLSKEYPPYLIQEKINDRLVERKSILMNGHAERCLNNVALQATEDSSSIEFLEVNQRMRNGYTNTIDTLLNRSNYAFYFVEKTLKELVPFEAGNGIGASFYGYSGGVFLNPKYLERPYLASEHIYHECRHSVFNHILIKYPLYENSPKEKFTSVLRKDKRPMFGLFHQLYVLVGLIELFKENDDEMLKAAESSFSDCINIIQSNAKLTEHGKEFIEMAVKYDCKTY
ncbi:HEXXH motif-containing putative peptide modification protein [Vibrio sp. CUB2]|uniref:aKG-HExxH-type peptide beta-hydroxylase n=1 Tax=Vibrio sp. CUB2 TaxID=2315233 RepID=UPI00076A85EF|nr:HEXXH motif-containing putative peptide modification protein [Vibrio sp. CUB2]